MGNNLSKGNLSDEWRTPDWLFNELNEEFNFDYDLCRTESNGKIGEFLGDFFELKKEKLLNKTCFINPPYSKPFNYIQKAWEYSLICKIVMLIPSGTCTRWWRIFWDSEFHTPKKDAQIRFFPYLKHHPSRISFIDPSTNKIRYGNPYGSILLILDRRTKIKSFYD